MSATGYLDACGFAPASTGAGNFVVSGALTGYQTPATAGAVNGAVYSYRAESADKTQWEEGFGPYASSGTTLSRTTITANSAGTTSAISFSTVPNVYITSLSSDLRNASLLNNGIVATAQLGSGAPGPTTALFGDQSYAGSPRLLNTVTANNSATVSDVTSLTANYSAYDIVLENLVPATNSISVLLQVQSAGAFQTSGYRSMIAEQNSVNNKFGTATFTNGVPLTAANNANNTGPGISGSLRIYNPGATSGNKTIGGTTTSNTAGTAARFAMVSGMWEGGTGAITGVQIAASSGNITSGTMKIYGVP